MKESTARKRKRLVKTLRESDEDDPIEIIDAESILDGYEVALIKEALELDRKRLRFKKKHGDYVV